MPTSPLGSPPTRPLSPQQVVVPRPSPMTSPHSNRLDYCTAGTVTITWTIEDLCDTTDRNGYLHLYRRRQPSHSPTRLTTPTTAASSTPPTWPPLRPLLDADLAAGSPPTRPLSPQPVVVPRPSPMTSPHNSFDYCTGGTVTITWTIEDLCDTQTVTADYIVTPPPALTFTSPADETHDACEFDAADLAAAQALLDADLAAGSPTTRPLSPPPVDVPRP